jgi:tetratricopeptide (TPR) repeat protein
MAMLKFVPRFLVSIFAAQDARTSEGKSMAEALKCDLHSAHGVRTVPGIKGHRDQLYLHPVLRKPISRSARARACLPKLALLLSVISFLIHACQTFAQLPGPDVTTARVTVLPKLPGLLQQQASRAEDAIDDLLSQPRDMSHIHLQIAQAKKYLALREKYQGNTWWQTQDAQRRVDDLLQLENMTREQRADLVKANTLASAVDELSIAERQKKADEAISDALTAAGLLKEVWGEDKPVYAFSLNLIAELYHDLGRYKDAEPFYEQALRIRRSSLGDQHPDYATSLNNLAELYLDTGRAQQAETYYLASLAVSKHALGSDDTDYAIELNNVAVVYEALARYDDAKHYSLQALSIDRRHRGRLDPAYAVDLKTLAEIYVSTGRYGDAERMYQQILAIDKRFISTRAPTYAGDLNNLALLYKQLGRSRQAAALLEKAVALIHGALGDDNRAYANFVGDLAGMYEDLGRYEDAERLYLRASSIDRDLLGPDHPGYADDINNLAGLYVTLGRFAEALPLYTQALNITRARLGDSHPDYAIRLNNLAELYQSMGWYGKAEPLFQEALELRARSLGDRHPDYASSLANLAELYGDMKRYDEERPLLEKALAIRGTALGKHHPDYAVSLNNLAGLYKSLHLFAKAEPLYREAAAINRGIFGEQSTPYALTLTNLALLYGEMSQYKKAIETDTLALTIKEHVGGASSPDYALGLNNLAEDYAKEGRYSDSERLLRQALTIKTKLLGQDSPEYANGTTNLALVLASQGKWEEAARLFVEASSAKWKHVTSNLGSFSPEQQQRWLQEDTFREGEFLWSCAFDGYATASQGLQAVLWRKQLGIDASRQQSAALRNAISSGSVEWQREWSLLSQWRTEYSELAMTIEEEEKGRTFRPRRPVQVASLQNLETRIKETEKRLRQSNQTYSQLSQLNDVTVTDLGKVLHPDEALVEYVRYRAVDFKAATYGNERYGVIVLRGGDGTVTAIGLGNADEVDQLVRQYRTEMAGVPALLPSLEDSPNGAKLQQSEATLGRIASRLRDRIWGPLEGALKGTVRVYVAPDGDLSLFPFEALTKQVASGEWHYLAEDDLQIIYVGTGRDLVDLVSSDPDGRIGAKSAVLIGNPNFHAEPKEIANTILRLADHNNHSATIEAQLSTEAVTDQFLSGVTRNWYEVPALGDILGRAREDLDGLGWSVTLHEGSAAAKEIAMSVKSPAILQFATHGITEDSTHATPEAWDNPLLHSMLILAGADTWNAETAVFYGIGDTAVDKVEAKRRGLSDEQLNSARIIVKNGLLTAYEVTGMDLNGTELVNLTACETGLGKVTPEGVVGLRQAFRLAGARSIIVSLWQIPADETISQVKDFYDLWLRPGQQAVPLSRYQAFRAAQLNALEQARRNHGVGHPLYWAGTIYLGDPGDLPYLSPEAETVK